MSEAKGKEPVDANGKHTGYVDDAVFVVDADEVTIDFHLATPNGPNCRSMDLVV